MLSTKHSISKRPYWHVDAKWIFGIIFTLSLSISLFLFSLAYLTSEKVAIPIATVMTASLFSPDGLDEEGDFEEIRREILRSGKEVIYPIPGQEVIVTKEDVNNLSVRELRLKIFRQVVEPYYLHGVDYVAESMTDDLKEQENIKKEAGILGILNINTNRFIYKLFFITLIPTLLSLAGLLYFSYKWGKLVSPGLIFLFVAIGPSIFLIFSIIFINTTDLGRLSLSLKEIIPMISQPLGWIYSTSSIFGVLLLLTAGLGKLWEVKYKR